MKYSVTLEIIFEEPKWANDTGLTLAFTYAGVLLPTAKAVKAEIIELEFDSQQTRPQAVENIIITLKNRFENIKQIKIIK